MRAIARAALLLAAFAVPAAARAEEPPRSTPPVRIRSAKPVYPESERRAGTTGVVVLDILIDEKGSVADTNVRATPGEAFSQAAIACVKKWRFRPGTADGVPATFRQTVTIDFRLKTTAPTPTSTRPPSRTPAAPK